MRSNDRFARKLAARTLRRRAERKSGRCADETCMRAFEPTPEGVVSVCVRAGTPRPDDGRPYHAYLSMTAAVRLARKRSRLALWSAEDYVADVLAEPDDEYDF